MAIRSNGSEPCALVLFGATGDLTRRKLVPALYNLLLDEMLPERFALVAVARKERDCDELVERLRGGVERYSRRGFDEQAWARLRRSITTVAADASSPDGLAPLRDHLAGIDRDSGTAGNRLFYLAIPPSAYAGIVGGLSAAGLHCPGEGGAFSRIVLEKPIGRDLASARALNRAVNEVFDEGSVYRIDHYLGKETVQNVLVFRFANAIFEPLWNQKYVDHVQITVAESIGVEGRGGYYEGRHDAGHDAEPHVPAALPDGDGAAGLARGRCDPRREGQGAAGVCARPSGEQVVPSTVRAQYAAGVVDGERGLGLPRRAGRRRRDSRTETYVAMHRLFVDNWRWAGVPFYLRAGKRMTKRVTEIALRFREVPHRLFDQGASLTTNTLALRIQPDEGITLKFDDEGARHRSRGSSRSRWTSATARRSGSDSRPRPTNG